MLEATLCMVGTIELLEATLCMDGTIELLEATLCMEDEAASEVGIGGSC